MEAPSDRDALYSVDFLGLRRWDWDFCGVVGWEEGALALVATCGVEDLAGKVEREILRNSTKIFISVVISEEKDTYFRKLGGFSAAMPLAFQAGTPHG